MMISTFTKKSPKQVRSCESCYKAELQIFAPKAANKSTSLSNPVIEIK